MTGIYKITNPLGQIYIGSSKDIFRRWSEHIKKGAKTKVNMSIKKHGAIHHNFEIIEHCIDSDLLKKERYWQDFYVSYSEFNLNVHKAYNTPKKYIKSTRDYKTKKIYYMDSTNGVFYSTLREICDLYDLNETSLRFKLSGFRNAKNNTIFVQV